MDRGAWRVTVHRVAQSQTRLKQLSSISRGTVVKCFKYQYLYNHIQSYGTLAPRTTNPRIAWGGREATFKLITFSANDTAKSKTAKRPDFSAFQH